MIGKTAPAVSWLKDDNIITNGGHFEISTISDTDSGITNSTLTITGLLHSDTGVYTCRAVESANKVNEYEFSIDVYGKTTLEEYHGTYMFNFIHCRCCGNHECSSDAQSVFEGRYSHSIL